MKDFIETLKKQVQCSHCNIKAIQFFNKDIKSFLCRNCIIFYGIDQNFLLQALQFKNIQLLTQKYNKKVMDIQEQICNIFDTKIQFITYLKQILLDNLKVRSQSIHQQILKNFSNIKYDQQSTKQFAFNSFLQSANQSHIKAIQSQIQLITLISNLKSLMNNYLHSACACCQQIYQKFVQEHPLPYRYSFNNDIIKKRQHIDIHTQCELQQSEKTTQYQCNNKYQSTQVDQLIVIQASTQSQPDLNFNKLYQIQSQFKFQLKQKIRQRLIIQECVRNSKQPTTYPCIFYECTMMAINCKNKLYYGCRYIRQLELNLNKQHVIGEVQAVCIKSDMKGNVVLFSKKYNNFLKVSKQNGIECYDSVKGKQNIRCFTFNYANQLVIVYQNNQVEIVYYNGNNQYYHFNIQSKIKDIVSLNQSTYLINDIHGQLYISHNWLITQLNDVAHLRLHYVSSISSLSQNHAAIFQTHTKTLLVVSLDNLNLYAKYWELYYQVVCMTGSQNHLYMSGKNTLYYLNIED